MSGMNKMQANLCLLCVTMMWSTEVIIFACIPDSVLPFATTCMTYLIGAAILFFCFYRRIAAEFRKSGKKLLLRCGLLAALNCVYNALFIYGLESFDVSTGAFTLSMTVVILPLVLVIRHRHVDKKTWVSSFVVLCGIVLALTINLGTFEFIGLGLIIIGCVLRAGFIIWLNDYAREHDPVGISAVMCLGVGVIGFVIWFFQQPATFSAIPWNNQIIASLFIYAYFVVAFAQTLNVFAQRRATPASATIIYATEIVFTVIWGSLLPANLIDPVDPTPLMLVAVGLIVLGNIVELWGPGARKKGAVQNV